MGHFEPNAPPARPDDGHVVPRYPVYIPSKGRWQRERALTIRWLRHDGVPFRVVVEPQEADAYAEFLGGTDELLVLPFSDLGQGVIPARNWIKDHSVEAGHERHWQLDDNTYGFYRMFKGKRLPVRAGVALRVCEDLTDRYENVAISGLNYDMFGLNLRKPFVANVHVYSCCLFLNSTPYRWRGRYNEDTDICLQALADGWCTILLNAFLVKKKWTMSTKGGNLDELYQGDGRLKMARSLERQWPYVVEVNRRFQRPQHVVRYSWRRFDTPLRLKPGVDLDALAKVDEYGMQLKAIADVRSPRMRKMVEEG